MAYALVAATALCFRNFLQSVNTGLLDMNVGHTGVDTMYSGSGATPKITLASKTLASKRSRQAKGFETVNLASLSRSENYARAGAGDGVSIASDSSQRGIMVRQTVDVRVGGDNKF